MLFDHFVIDGKPEFAGYHDPKRLWNGFNMPYFPEAQAHRIAAMVNDLNGEPTLRIDTHTHTAHFNEAGESYSVPAKKIMTEHGLKLLYNIGVGWWVWYATSRE